MAAFILPLMASRSASSMPSFVASAALPVAAAALPVASPATSASLPVASTSKLHPSRLFSSQPCLCGGCSALSPTSKSDSTSATRLQPQISHKPSQIGALEQSRRRYSQTSNLATFPSIITAPQLEEIMRTQPGMTGC